MVVGQERKGGVKASSGMVYIHQTHVEFTFKNQIIPHIYYHNCFK